MIPEPIIRLVQERLGVPNQATEDRSKIRILLMPAFVNLSTPFTEEVGPAIVRAAFKPRTLLPFAKLLRESKKQGQFPKLYYYPGDEGFTEVIVDLDFRATLRDIRNSDLLPEGMRLQGVNITALQIAVSFSSSFDSSRFEEALKLQSLGQTMRLAICEFNGRSLADVQVVTNSCSAKSMIA